MSDCRETPIHEIGAQEPVSIWPMEFMLLGSRDKIAGCLISDGVIRTYVILKDAEHQLPSIPYLRLLLEASPMIVGDIFKRAYMNRRHLEVNEEIVLWCEYQSILSHCRFHKPLPPPSQILSILGDNADGEDEQEDREDGNP